MYDKVHSLETFFSKIVNWETLRLHASKVHSKYSKRFPSELLAFAVCKA